MATLEPARLLAAYQSQLRARTRETLPEGVRSERDGPLVRTAGRSDRGFVEYKDLGGIEGAELDELIRRQIGFFAARGERFEWKLHGHDRPADLPERLRAAGFVPEDEETVLVALAEDVARGPVLPDGITLRHVRDRTDLDRIEAMEQAVWEDRELGLADMLQRLHRTDPEGLAIVVAEAGGEVVCGGWVRFERGTEFATLWGGATLPAYRGRGVYRALVAHRAQLAAARGFRYLEVDASANSRPILARLGFVAVTTTTPYVWSLPSSTSG